LDRLGVRFIEGGWAGANPKDGEFFARMGQTHLTQARLVVFCSTRRPGISASEDPMLVPILAAATEWVTVFGKSWDLHVTEGLRTTPEENLLMIGDTIRFLRQRGRRVIYDAEHWFDGHAANPNYGLQTVAVAIAAGADWVVFCDTNGGRLPQEVAASVAAVRSQFPEFEQWGIHTHNDSGLAVANAIAAVQQGVRMVQGTINGYGERCGNANLCTLIPNLQLKLNIPCLPESQLRSLTEVSRQISELVNLAPDDHAPYVGLSAFAHKGGIHVSAVQRNPITYEHIAPELVGNDRRIVISEQSGLSNVLSKAASFGIELRKDDPACREILQQLKDLEQDGYQFEAAEASFELLMRQGVGDRPIWFTVQDFQVHCHHGLGYEITRATVKVSVKDSEHLTTAEGNGPVAALDAALRKALTAFYPAIAPVHLTDYKVRILNSDAGTEAKTRVLIEFSDHRQRWTTVGVSENIITASLRALIDGLEYGIRRTVLG
ncbi:MAG: citramalate synthase, partial [Oscillatoriales cyanobacterium SM2_2_1]|nr:citramalate synthase [Oscillatoriales cyanobacterium SM2_2_1]